MIIYAVPSGGRLDIAEAELKALLEASGQAVDAAIHHGLVTSEVKELPGWAIGRAAYLSDVGELLWEGPPSEVEKVAADLDVSRMAGRRFKVDAEGFDGPKKLVVDDMFGERVLTRAKNSSVSLKEPEVVLRVFRGAEEAFVGLTVLRRDGKWVARRPRARAFFHPSALFPKLARLMVNLTAVRPGETFLDPFSGTGSTLIEASLVGAFSLGIDVDKKMVFGGRRNLRGFGLDAESQVLHADVRELPLREVDAIAGDVPYGRASSTMGAGSDELLSAALEQGERCLKRGRRIVLMHRKGATLVEPKGFQLLGEYEFYVHRSLTRVISVFRKW